jgi:pheromone shutdown protein TraB
MFWFFMYFVSNSWNLFYTSVEDIEKCKKRDMLEQLLTELAGEYPAFRDVFLNERDIFLTNSLQAAAASAQRKIKSREGN